MFLSCSTKFPQQNINQSESWIGGFQLSVELYAWMLRPWTPRPLDSGLLDSRRLNSGRLDAWNQEILSIFSNILLLFNVEFLNISNILRLMHYGFVERAANNYYNSDLL